MTEYYRVRTQEQWDWLMQWFEKVDKGIRWDYSGEKPTEYNNWKKFKSNSYIALLGNVTLFYGDVERDELSDFIEVSKLMEGEKMEDEDYITIKGENLEKIHWETNYGRTSFINYDENGEKYAHEQFFPAILSIPKSLIQQKVKMTQAEKDEFDKLKDEMSLDRHDLDDLLTRIKDSEDFPLLYHRLYVADGDGVESQLEFAHAWANPSLIEVIPEKRWNVKVPPFEKTNKYYHKSGGKLGWADSVVNDGENQQFTESELKEYGLDDDMYEKVEVTDDGTK